MMCFADISSNIVDKNTSFTELYSLFNLNIHKQLLVVDDNESCIGVIGLFEINAALNLPDFHKLCAVDIANVNFTAIIYDSDMREECFRAFYYNDFDIIPILSEDNYSPIGLAHRNDFLEFRMICFSTTPEEEIVLNYIFLFYSDLFWIDLGAYDPWDGNVTKWLSISGRGNGINVEPLIKKYNLLEIDRPNDINIHSAVGDKEGSLKLYVSGPFTTARMEYCDSDFETVDVPVTTLQNICNSYALGDKEIHFLKIDVEGYEKQVLQGADFSKYRPWVVLIESTRPNTDIPTYEDWEHILVESRYVFAKQYGVNRFYVAEERQNILLKKFLNIENMKKRLIIYNYIYE